MTKQLAFGLIAVLAAGCVQHNWVPGPQAAGDLGVVSGRCKLAALGAPQQGYFVAASGSPQFVGASVGGAAIGHGLGEAIRQQNIFNACMEANGFVAADAAPGQTAATAPASGSVATPTR